MNCHMLIVEDSAQIREACYDFFVRESGGHFIIDLAEDGIKGLRMALENEYDIVILDIMLPGASGYEICRALRNKGSCPIIFLTALGTEDSILKGYELGGDEYVVKPFSLKVLYAKCLAILNRTKGGEGKKDMDQVVGSIRIDPVKMQVWAEGETVDLPPKEYFLLKALMDNPGVVLSRDALLDRVWGRDYVGIDRVVDNHIKNLRRSLGKSGSQIRTVFGCGYKITGN
ncbi:DNA-binding response regulator, OmpR family, contains REC and winged-helix (wHTH) domain [Ruminococcaceae bacterium YRB3002]|nr:DNA-binding response regulator, OmpR family, contains REC and winged-helix (wHTH) domain [Ruminococcaceae bacterium YRB3002]